MKEIGLHHLAHFDLRITGKKSWEKKVEEENIPILFDGVVQWPNCLA